MLWFIIGIVFILITITAWFGDYEQKEIKQDYEKFKEVMNGSDNTFKRKSK